MEREVALDAIARTVHEAMRAYQQALGENVVPAWVDSGWMQDSSREGVEFALGNPLPGAQHEQWCRTKERDGWVWGAVKDETAKTHPSLRPFDDLPESEKIKDGILIGVVQALAPLYGLSPRDAAEHSEGP